MLAVFGVVLWWSTAVAQRPRARSIGLRTGLGLGVAQALALQPGVSRSGITMTAARLIGIDRERAARFSFLLAIPIIAGAGLFKGVDLRADGFQGYGPQFFWGFVVVRGERVRRDLGPAGLPAYATPSWSSCGTGSRSRRSSSC